MTILRSLKIEILSLCVILCANSVLGHSSTMNSDSLHQLFLDNIYQALEFQKKHQRDRLDSIMDIAIPMAEELGQEKNMAYSYYLKADGLSQKKPKDAIKLAELALDFYRTDGDTKMISVILLIKGNCQLNIGKHKDAIASYEEAIENSLISIDSESPNEQHKRLVMQYSIGLAQNEMGDLMGASQNMYEVFTKAKKAKNKIVIPAALQQLGNLAIYREDYHEAIDIFREGVDLSKKDFPRSIVANLSGLSLAFRKLDQLDSAKFYSNKALELNLKNQNIRSATINLQELAEIHVRSQEFDKAIAYNNRLLEMAKEAEMPHRIFLANLGLCVCHVEKKDFELAQHYSNALKNNIQNIHEFDKLADAYKCMAKTSEHSGDYRSAYSYQKLHQQYSDSVLNESSTAQLDKLHVQYKTKRNEEKIQQLELQRQVGQLATRQRNLWFMIIGILGLGLLGFVLFDSHRRKLLLEKQKENIEQRLLRSQMNPHFIFNAISSIQNYLFDVKDQKTALQYLSKFSELMRQILENSREAYITLQDELDALSNYLELQLLRYNQKFQFEIIVHPDIDVESLHVPPLILQPFVENAIEHGKIYLFDDGKVTINITLEGNDLIIHIIDNGKGFEQINKTITTSKNNSLGTQITKERLAYLSRLFNKKFQFIFLNENPRGTHVYLTLPKVSQT